MTVNTDIDIDLPDRASIVKKLNHIPASILKDHEVRKHNSGVYLQNIPINPLTDTATYDYREAEKLGYFKVDFLNNSVYTGIKSEEELNELMKEPNWELLTRKDIVESLPHIHDYYKVVRAIEPKSVEDLAILIALLRPAKHYLLGEDWDKVKREIWQPPRDSEYYFKKSHSISYAMLIVVALNRLDRGY